MNCQLYRGWCLGKHKPGVIPDREGLVDPAGETIQIQGLGFSGGVGVGSCEGDGASVLDLCDEALWEEAVGVGEGGPSYFGEGGSY